MFLRVLKTNQATNLILFPLIAIAFWVTEIITPREYVFLPGESQMVLYYPIYLLLFNYPQIQEIVSLVFVIILGFSIQRLNGRYPFYSIRTLLPSSVFILLVSGMPELHVLHPVYFAAVFFVFSIVRAFGIYEKADIHSSSFDSGFLLAIGSLFYFNLAFLFPVLLMALRIIKREFNFKNFILCFFGFLIPWIFTFSFYFFFDKTNQLIGVLKFNLFLQNDRLTHNIPLLAYAGFIGLLVLISGIQAVSHFDKKKISIRKYYSAFLLLVVALAALIAISPSASAEAFVLMAVPATFLISSLFLSIKKQFRAELLFAIFIGVVVLMQFAHLFFNE
jgi:hypothetical protein